MEQLSYKVFQYIWSAINQPNLTQHSGQAILQLLLANSNTTQRIVLEDFAQKRSAEYSETILVEIQNILSAKPDVCEQVELEIKKGAHDPLMPVTHVAPAEAKGSGIGLVDAGSFVIGLVIAIGVVVVFQMTGRLYYGLFFVAGGMILKSFMS